MGAASVLYIAAASRLAFSCARDGALPGPTWISSVSERFKTRPTPPPGWVPAGRFRLGRWAWPVPSAAAAYLILMLVNVVLPSGLSSGRACFNRDWITRLVMAAVTAAGVIVFFAAHRGREIGAHLTGPAVAGPPGPVAARREDR